MIAYRDLIHTRASHTKLLEASSQIEPSVSNLPPGFFGTDATSATVSLTPHYAKSIGWANMCSASALTTQYPLYCLVVAG